MEPKGATSSAHTCRIAKYKELDRSELVRGAVPGLHVLPGFLRRDESQEVYEALGGSDADRRSWTGLKHDGISQKCYTGLPKDMSMIKNKYRRVWGRSRMMALLDSSPSLVAARAMMVEAVARCYCRRSDAPSGGTPRLLELIPETFTDSSAFLIHCEPNAVTDVTTCPTRLMPVATAYGVIPPPATHTIPMSLLTEQLIRYGTNDLFFNLHWDIDAKNPSEPLPHNVTGSELGPGDVIGTLNLGCEAALLLKPRYGARCAEGRCVFLKQGDAYILSGEARWQWLHGISVEEGQMPRRAVVWRFKARYELEEDVIPTGIARGENQALEGRNIRKRKRKKKS